MQRRLIVAAATVMCLWQVALPQVVNRGNLRVNVSARVTLVDTILRYQYGIANSVNSQQMLDAFYLEVGDLRETKGGTIQGFVQPEGWEAWMLNAAFQPSDQNAKDIVLWYTDDSLANEADLMIPARSAIASGGSLEVSFSSKGLPSLKRFLARGWARPLTEQEYDSLLSIGFREEDIQKRWDEDGYKGNIVSPQLPPQPFVATMFLDMITGYTTQSHSLGWIKDQPTADKYLSYFSSARTKLVQGDSVGARTPLQQVLRDVDIDRIANLTSEAYALLRYNTEYLISTLPQR